MKHKILEMFFSFPVVIKSSHCSDHMIAVDSRNTIFVAGDNESGQLGRGNFNPCKEPLQLGLGCTVSKIAVGCFTTFMFF
jgi:alpha-tubulin suppressor-like RCC1 family protein